MKSRRTPSDAQKNPPEETLEGGVKRGGEKGKFWVGYAGASERSMFDRLNKQQTGNLSL